MAATTETKETRSLLRTLQGVVASAKTKKTIKVVLTYQAKHPKYGKYMNRRTVLAVHDEKSEAREGDVVIVAECRPISRTKHHRLLKIVTRGNAPLKAEEPSDVKA
jgi:small subunit ribosomal protein S17